MSSEDFRQNPKNNEPHAPTQQGNNSSRFEDAKEQEQQEQYNRHYKRIAEVLEKGTPDFRLIAKETGLKERRVRDTLLFRLTTGDMLQLFGQKDGVCYTCGNRMNGNFTQEPLCLACIDTLGNKIKELYPPEIELLAPATNDVCTIESKTAVQPPPGMVTQEQYDLLLAEVNRYRDKYGPLDSPLDSPKDKFQTETPTAQEEDAVLDSTSSEISDSTAANDAFDILHIEEDANDKDETVADEMLPSSEPIRHFGFQRLRSRN